MVPAKRILTWGVAWGIGVTLLEQLLFTPIADWGSVGFLFFCFFPWLLPAWCAIGAAFVWLVARRADRRSRHEMLWGWLAVAAVGAIGQQALAAGIWQLLTWLHLREAWLSLFHDLRLPWPAYSASVVMYNFCICLLYGGLVMLAFALVLRHERMRALLHDAAIARARTQTLLDETRLEFLQQQIDPALLLDSMHELERRYRNDPERAERLLEKLVDFLRCAMPGLRSTKSTVTTELHLARAYADLQLERGVDARWQIEGPAEGAEHAPFPSLVMLPLLAQVKGNVNPSLRMASAQGRVDLSLHGTGDVVSAELVAFLRTRLRNLYGNKFSIAHDRSAFPQLQITLSLDHT
jgi:hypothetical protein